ncbi:MAG: hypothetical protein R6W70_08760 [bacterium]
MSRLRFVMGSKNMVMFFILSALILAYMWTYVDDVMYFFSDRTPADLGSAMDVDKDVLADISDGDYVKISGIRSIQGGTFESGLFAEPHMVYYLTGNKKFLILEKKPEDEEGVGPRRMEVKGRIYAFSSDSRAERMREFFKTQLLLEMSPDGYLIKHGDIPGEDYTSLVVFIILMIFFIFNVYTMFKTYKKNEEIDFEEI